MSQLTPADIDRISANITAVSEWAEGNETFVATMANGLQVPSPLKVITDSKLYKGEPIAWGIGINVTDAAQTYIYNDILYAPQPGKLPFVTGGVFDPLNWYVFSSIVASGGEVDFSGREIVQIADGTQPDSAASVGQLDNVAADVADAVNNISVTLDGGSPSDPENNQYQTIDEAVDAIINTGTITVVAGTYEFSTAKRLKNKNITFAPDEFVSGNTAFVIRRQHNSDGFWRLDDSVINFAGVRVEFGDNNSGLAPFGLGDNGGVVFGQANTGGQNCTAVVAVSGTTQPVVTMLGGGTCFARHEAGSGVGAGFESELTLNNQDYVAGGSDATYVLNLDPASVTNVNTDDLIDGLRSPNTDTSTEVDQKDVATLNAANAYAESLFSDTVVIGLDGSLPSDPGNNQYQTLDEAMNARKSGFPTVIVILTAGTYEWSQNHTIRDDVVIELGFPGAMNNVNTIVKRAHLANVRMQIVGARLSFGGIGVQYGSSGQTPGAFNFGQPFQLNNNASAYFYEVGGGTEYACTLTATDGSLDEAFYMQETGVQSLIFEPANSGVAGRAATIVLNGQNLCRFFFITSVWSQVMQFDIAPVGIGAGNQGVTNGLRADNFINI